MCGNGARTGTTVRKSIGCYAGLPGTNSVPSICCHQLDITAALRMVAAMAEVSAVLLRKCLNLGANRSSTLPAGVLLTRKAKLLGNLVVLR